VETKQVAKSLTLFNTAGNPFIKGLPEAQTLWVLGASEGLTEAFVQALPQICNPGAGAKNS